MVQRLNNLGDDLAPRLHSVKISDILKTNDHTFDAGQAGMIARQRITPAPTAILALQPAAAANRSTRAGREGAKTFADTAGIVRMEQANDWLSNQVFRSVAK